MTVKGAKVRYSIETVFEVTDEAGRKYVIKFFPSKDWHLKLVRMNIDDGPAFLLELYGRFVSARKVARYAQRPEDVNAAY